MKDILTYRAQARSAMLCFFKRSSSIILMRGYMEGSDLRN